MSKTAHGRSGERGFTALGARMAGLRSALRSACFWWVRAFSLREGTMKQRWKQAIAVHHWTAGGLETLGAVVMRAPL